MRVPVVEVGVMRMGVFRSGVGVDMGMPYSRLDRGRMQMVVVVVIMEM